jgi:hypothetical protein
MRRREFITLLGAATAWPIAARAQQAGRLVRIGVLGPTLSNPPAIEQYRAFRTRLTELGFQEGQNVTIDYRPVDDPRGPFVAALELVRSRPELIVATGPWSCENSGAPRARRRILENRALRQLNHPAHMRFESVLENCIFRISPIYAFSHRLGQKHHCRRWWAPAALFRS